MYNKYLEKDNLLVLKKSKNGLFDLVMENINFIDHISEKIKRNVPLSEFTTFKVGGPSDYLIEIENEEEFEGSILWAIDKRIPYFILGKGANVLVNDNGYRGLIIYTGKFNEISENNVEVSAKCGALLDDLVEYVSTKGLSGMEFLAGMPGTVGGAVYMNARAYGGEISNVIRDASVLIVDEKKRTVKKQIIRKKEMEFSYKSSIFQRKNVYLLEATFKLKRGNKQQIANKVSEIRSLRREKGEYLFPSAGCIFKNDYSIGVSTGKIIDECGLKGLKIGNAEVYERHANFIINKGGAKAKDIYNLIKLIEKEVKEKTGIKLKREIVLVGFNGLDS